MFDDEVHPAHEMAPACLRAGPGRGPSYVVSDKTAMTTSTCALPMRGNQPTFTGRDTARPACNVVRLSLGELLVNQLQVVKRTNTLLIS